MSRRKTRPNHSNLLLSLQAGGCAPPDTILAAPSLQAREGASGALAICACATPGAPPAAARAASTHIQNAPESAGASAEGCARCCVRVRSKDGEVHRRACSGGAPFWEASGASARWRPVACMHTARWRRGTPLQTLTVHLQAVALISTLVNRITRILIRLSMNDCTAGRVIRGQRVRHQVRMTSMAKKESASAARV